MGIILSFSPFPCGLTDHKFTTIGSILIPLSVGTQGWLKINNLSFASCSLIFAGAFFLSALWCCCCYCCAALFGGIFSLHPPSPFHFPILYSLEKKERFPGCSRWYGTGQLFQFHSVNSFWCLFLRFGFSWLSGFWRSFWTRETRGVSTHNCFPCKRAKSMWICI